MNVKKAHEHLKDAENSIRNFFLPADNLSVICCLLKLARTVDTLAFATAYTKVALREMTYGSGGDEREVVVASIKKALSELEYQRQCDATR